MKLSDRTVGALVCPPGRRDMLLFDADLKGFGIRVTAAGARAFLYQYRAGTAVRRKRLGDWPTVTTAAARRMAEQLRGSTVSGSDPVAATRAARVAAKAAAVEARTRAAADRYTVAALIDEWKALHLAGRSPAYALEAPRRLKAALANSLTVPASRFQRTDAVRALDGVAGRVGPIQASRVRAYARAAFAWAVKRGSVETNPFRDLPRAAAERSRDRVLSDDEIGRLWLACDHVGEPWGSLVRLLLATGQRRGEVAGMAWAEVAQQTWALPRERTKNGVAHDVPLSAAARGVLDAIEAVGDCPLVLSQGLPRPPSGFGRAKIRLDKQMGPGVPAWVLHDIRRSVATGLQRLGVRLEVTEAVLNHVSGSRAGIVGVYQRHRWTEDKRAALEAWSDHVLQCADAVRQRKSSHDSHRHDTTNV